MTPASLARRSAWVFDLDNTLYPAHFTVFDAIGARMTAFVQRLTGLPADKALALQEHYHDQFGATVTGLVRHHDIDADAFLDDVHQVDLSEIVPDGRLRALLQAYDGRRVVFTNGAAGYAARVLERLGVADLFHAVIAIDDVELAPKPDAIAFVRMATLAGVDAHDAVMFEDSARNLATARHLGYATVLVTADDAPKAAFVDFKTPSLHDFLEQVLAPQ